VQFGQQYLGGADTEGHQLVEMTFKLQELLEICHRAIDRHGQANK